MKHTHTVTTLRAIHALIVAYLFVGIGVIYYSAFTRTTSFLLFISVVSLLIEGLVVYINRGNCPFGYIQQRFGDTTPFFALILPKRYARYAVRVCALITLTGMILLLFRLVFT